MGEKIGVLSPRFVIDMSGDLGLYSPRKLPDYEDM